MARETTSGEFHGSTSSVGLSSNGISVSGGSLHGNTSSSSHLAQQVARPDFEVYEPGNPYGFSFLVAFLGGLAVLGSESVFTALFDAGLGPAMPMFNGFLSYWPKIVGGLMLLVAGANFLKMLAYEPDVASAEEVEQMRVIALKMSTTYDRLMYCPADHIVFDPITTRSCQAEQMDIKKMLADICTNA